MPSQYGSAGDTENTYRIYARVPLGGFTWAWSRAVALAAESDVQYASAEVRSYLRNRRQGLTCSS